MPFFVVYSVYIRNIYAFLESVHLYAFFGFAETSFFSRVYLGLYEVYIYTHSLGLHKCLFSVAYIYVYLKVQIYTHSLGSHKHLFPVVSI